MIYDLIFNTEQLLTQFLVEHGSLFYLLLASIILAETGLFFAAFLPGDSLLFVSGVVVAHSDLNFILLSAILITASILGNVFNFYTGRWIGRKVYQTELIPFIDREALEKARMFFERHGGSSIIFARFLPFFRTLVPFFCGMSMFAFFPFLFYSVVGGMIWVLGMTSLGYFLGHWWFVREYISIIVLTAMAIAFTPAIALLIKNYRSKKA